MPDEVICGPISHSFENRKFKTVILNIWVIRIALTRIYPVLASRHYDQIKVLFEFH